MAAAVRPAGEPDGHDEAHRFREHDPGYYLIAGGRRAFEKEIGFRVSAVELFWQQAGWVDCRVCRILLFAFVWRME